MKKRVYIETRVVSYYTSKLSRDLITAARQEQTNEFWSRWEDDFEPYISPFVLMEVTKGDMKAAAKRIEVIKSFKLLEVCENARQLTHNLIEARAIPHEKEDDAAHIAMAAVNGIDIIVTWNFSHINNLFKKSKIKDIVESAGYVCPAYLYTRRFIGGKRMKNLIIEEIHKIRDEHTKKFNHDIDAIFEDMRKSQEEFKKQGFKAVSLEPKRIKKKVS